MSPMIGLAAWLAVAAAGGVAPAAPPDAAPALEAPAPLADGGLVVFRDPATGLPTSVPPEGVTFSQLTPAFAYEPPAEQRRTASGAWIANVPESLHSFAIATIGPDGLPVWTCVDGQPAATGLPTDGVGRDANGEETK